MEGKAMPRYRVTACFTIWRYRDAEFDAADEAEARAKAEDALADPQFQWDLVRDEGGVGEPEVTGVELMTTEGNGTAVVR
jgi:hypothetical protein